eukprot:5912843-Pyramimonas_sp.AAC.1
MSMADNVADSLEKSLDLSSFEEMDPSLGEHEFLKMNLWNLPSGLPGLQSSCCTKGTAGHRAINWT